MTDRQHCGSCGNACDDGEVCSEGECALSCGGGTPTQCGDSCVNTSTNPAHCGDCGEACESGQVCADGQCEASCGGSTPLLCGDRCVDPDTDRLHCGGCAGDVPPADDGGVSDAGIADAGTADGGTVPVGGTTCQAGEVCSGGTCQLSCGGDTPKRCGNSCVNTGVNDNHCGGCGNACPADTRCSGGSCVTGLIIDTFTGGASSSTRDAGDSCGTQLTVGESDVQISEIAVRNDLDGAANLKFLIYDHTAGETREYLSASKPFADGGMSWKRSDPLHFVLRAGRTYDIGAIADTAGSWAYDTTAESEGGITTTVSNPNITDYSDPDVAAHGGGDCAVRLYY